MKWFGILLIIVGALVLVWYTINTKNNTIHTLPDRHLSTTQERYQIIGGISLTLGLIIIVSSTGEKRKSSC